jgi:putative holliday junction resolvase
MQKIMGIDYGSHRVGVAFSDDGGNYAFPKTILENNNTLLERIAELAAEAQVSLIVLGEADNPAGGENTIVRRITIFKSALEVRLGLPVELVSEAFTSAEARRALEARLQTRSTKEVAVDAAAAALILQTYLDTIKNK